MWAISTRCAGAGNTWPTWSGSRSGSSSMRSKWATSCLPHARRRVLERVVHYTRPSTKRASSMPHTDDMPNRAISDYLDLALRLANVFPAVVDLETGEIVGPNGGMRSSATRRGPRRPGWRPGRPRSIRRPARPRRVLGRLPRRASAALPGRVPGAPARRALGLDQGRRESRRTRRKGSAAAAGSWRSETSTTSGRPSSNCGSASGSSTRSWGTFRDWPTGPWPTITGPPCSPARAWKT